ncbi:NAD-dependent epimerase/dehydratase family protein [Actinopolymorpha singaporensis]
MISQRGRTKRGCGQGGTVRYLVTGVAGFLGSHVAEALLPHATAVTGVDCLTDYYPTAMKERNLRRLLDSEKFTFVEADLRHADLSSLVATTDVVLHQAGQPGVRTSWGEDFAAYVEHNIVATHRLLEWSRQAHIKRFVYASSSSVYGNADSYPTTEASLPRPFSPYGTTKLAAEHLCGAYAENWGLPTVALRYFTVYGPRQRPDMAIHRFIQAAAEGRDIHLYGTGEQARDFTYVDDVVRANLLAAWKPIRPGTVLNIAGGSHVSVNMLLDKLGDIVGRPLTVRRGDTCAGDVDNTRADCSKAALLLDWRPLIDMTTGLTRQVEWQLAAYGTAKGRARHGWQVSVARSVAGPPMRTATT